MEHLLTKQAPGPDQGVASPAPLGPGSSEQPPAGTAQGPTAQCRGAMPTWSAKAQGACDALGSWRLFDLALVAALMAISLGLRWRTMWASYWGDEAIAIGIAAHSIGSLPRYLVDDGSPPLYYVMLHYWMELFGRSEPATHTLSMIPALLAVPAAWWSGTRLFGRWAGRGAAALVATCAYLDYYSTETRMYSWLVLSAILGLTLFVLAYRGAGRRYWVGATVVMTATLYLQYYGLYLVAATVVVGAVAALRTRSWPRLRATLLYGLACAAAFAPWVPQFLYQVRNTGAPWAPHPSVVDFFADSFNALASAGWPGIVIAIAVAVLLAKKPDQPPAGASMPSAAPPSGLGMATAVPLVTLVMAWTGGQLVNSWNPRYLGIITVPAMLALAGGLARARRGLLALLLAVTCLAATAVPVLVDRTITVATSKSDVAELVAELRPRLRPGALVISAEVTDTPIIALDLGKGYRYATPLGLLRHPLVVNWSNLPKRLHGVSAASNLAPLLAALPLGGEVLVFNPTTWGGPSTPQRYEGPVKAVGIAANQVVVDDPQLRAVVTEGVPRYSNPLYPMTAALFLKVRTSAKRDR